MNNMQRDVVEEVVGEILDIFNKENLPIEMVELISKNVYLEVQNTKMKALLKQQQQQQQINEEKKGEEE